MTVYDAAYVAAARSRDARLATLDRDLLRAKLGQRPSELLNELGLETEERAMTWTDNDLAKEFQRYAARAAENGLTGTSLRTYLDRVQRFLNWRLGNYRPRGAVSKDRPVPSAAVTAAGLRGQAETFVDALRTAALEQPTIDTYKRHALFFVRWLEGDFDPGSTRS